VAAFRVGVATAVAAVGGWAASLGHLGVHEQSHGGTFGSSARVHIAHVGRIDVDLESTRSTGLRRAPCVGAAYGTRCFVASAPH
jgi:hypothetical protein